MSRKVAIIISVVMALAVTFAITRAVNVRYSELKETVEIAKASQFIPMGAEIRQDQISAVQVPKSIGKDLASPVDVIGKASRVSLVEGQFIFPGSLESLCRKPGMVEIHVPVDLSSSASVIAGDIVDIFSVDKGQGAAKAVELYQRARVLRALDQNGVEINPSEPMSISHVANPPGAKVPASVGLEVSREAVAILAQAASQKRIYLVKSN